MNKTFGCIFDIQRFSLHDGPGIRTTVFLKGCNLRCYWCHNPESVNLEPEIQIYSNKCIRCGKCAMICPQNAIIKNGNDMVFSRDLCTKCGECLDECFAQARVMVGKTVSAAEIMAEICKDKAFYETSGGGVTFSGGEPMLQAGFLKTLLKACKAEGIHTAVDTAGNVAFDKYEDIIPYTDLFLYDVKVMDEQIHKQVTGVTNRKILNNLMMLSKAAKSIYIRIPVVPTVNDNEDNFVKTGELLKGLEHIDLVELLAFHKMASGKYDGLGKEYKAKDLEPLSKDRMNVFKDILAGYGLNTKVSI
jgi:pyruvate formate lyase activating enzyme